MPESEVGYALRILARNGFSEATLLLKAENLLDNLIDCIENEICGNCWHSFRPAPQITTLEKHNNNLQRELLLFKTKKFLQSLREEK